MITWTCPGCREPEQSRYGDEARALIDHHKQHCPDYRGINFLKGENMMIVPTEEALQELWLSHRVERAEREHRPHPDYSLFIAEFKTAIERIKADAWDEGYEASDHEAYYFSTHGDTDNPYRKQEEA